MSTETKEHALRRTSTRDRQGVAAMDKKESVKNYKGFVAGVFSGIAKLSGKCLFISSSNSLPSVSQAQAQAQAQAQHLY